MAYDIRANKKRESSVYNIRAGKYQDRTALNRAAFPTLSAAQPTAMQGKIPVPEQTKADLNRKYFPTLSAATPTVSTGANIKKEDTTRKGVVGTITELAAPTRGFSDIEVREQQTKKTSLKDSTLGIARYAAEIGGGVLNIHRMINNAVGIKTPEFAKKAISKVEEFAQPKNVGEAATMRNLDTIAFVPATIGRTVFSVAKKLSKVDDVAEVASELGKLGVRSTYDFAQIIAKEKNVNRIQELITQAQKRDSEDFFTQRSLTNDTVPTPKKSVDGIERRFTQRAQALMPEAKISSTYAQKRSTDLLAQKARTLVQENPTQAYRIAKGSGEINDVAVAVASEFLKNIQSRALATTDKATKLALYDQAADVAESMAKKLTEAGRTVQAASILTRLTPEGMVRFATREIDRFNATSQTKIPNLTGEQARHITEEMDAIGKMPEGLAKQERLFKLQDTIKSWIPTPFFKKITTVWRAGLLTGLKTTGLNLGSNLFHTASEILKDIPAAGFDRAASLFTGERAKTATIRKAFDGIKEGTIKGKKYFSSGFDERNIGVKLDYKKVNFKHKFFEKYTDLVFRTMGATDQPFYYAAYSRSLMDQALAVGMNKGLKGEKLRDFAYKSVENPTEKMVEYGILDATTAVFQNDTRLGELAKDVQQLGSKQGFPIGEILVPFAQTPSAVAMQVINYSPLGFIKPMTRIASALKMSWKKSKLSAKDLAVLEEQGQKMFDQRLWSAEMGRATTGTAFLALGYALAEKGLMSGDFPIDSKREQELQKLEGKKSNAILIQFPWEDKPKWRSPMVLGPAGIVMLAGGQLHNAIQKEGSPTKAAISAMFGTMKSFLEQTFLTGVNDAMSAINDPEKKMAGYLSKLIASAVPTIVSDVARATDPYERTVAKGLNADTFVQNTQARIPGARRLLTPQYDTMGRKIDSVGNPAEIMLDPTRPSPEKTTPVIDELRRLEDEGYPVTPTRSGKDGSTSGYPSLSQDENARLWRTSGRIISSTLETVMEDPKYVNAPDDKKSEVVEKIIKEAKLMARAQIIARQLRDKTPEEQQELLLKFREDELLTRDVAKRLQAII